MKKVKPSKRHSQRDKVELILLWVLGHRRDVIKQLLQDC
jgi:hypothetical protein